MKAFIFDLDGVIVFTDKFHYLAWKKWQMRWGFILTRRLITVSAV